MPGEMRTMMAMKKSMGKSAKATTSPISKMSRAVKRAVKKMGKRF